LRFFCWILMSFAMITVANSKLTSTQLLRSCCQIVKGCLLYTRIPITWSMYPSTKRRASSDTLVPETDSMHPVIQLHFSTQPFDSCRFQVQLPSIFAEPEWGLLRTRPKYTALRPLGQSPQAPFSYISVVMDCGIHFFRKASL